MVRREEQPHQSRATILLDSRESAHRGTGPASSFEYAVSAAASIGAHLARHQFVVRLLSEEKTADAHWHDRGISGPAEVQLLLDALAVVQTSPHTEFAGGAEYHSSGLVIAVLGAVSSTDLAGLSRLRAGSTRALAILIDVAAWSRTDGRSTQVTAAADEQAAALRRQGWTVVVAGPGDRLATLWGDLGRIGSQQAESSFSTTQGPAA
jgi:uncharacterized protein (DUF58 family)